MDFEMTFALLLRLSRFCVNRMSQAQSRNKPDNGRRATPVRQTYNACGTPRPDLS
jgi:hypothetical protein